MANVSNWKGFEKDVAEALGGKRRHRTMGSYATVATDVRFRKKSKKKYPVLKKVMVECKKRRILNIVALFSEATTKYGGEDKYVILATKRPVGRMGAAVKRLEERIKSRYCIGKPIHKKRIQALKKSGEVSKKDLKKLEKKLNEDCKKQIKWETKLLKAKLSNTALVTVTLDYFSELFKAWKHTNRHDRTK